MIRRYRATSSRSVVVISVWLILRDHAESLEATSARDELANVFVPSPVLVRLFYGHPLAPCGQLRFVRGVVTLTFPAPRRTARSGQERAEIVRCQIIGRAPPLALAIRLAGANPRRATGTSTAVP